jgi:putative YphP/YqiW family bacilliredoxin
MIVVNSICGCAAGKARPGVALALTHAVRPDRVATVFAGADLEATDRARGYFTGSPPSSPSIGLLRDGQFVWMLERWQIENQGPLEIAALLTSAFDRFCVPEAAAQRPAKSHPFGDGLSCGKTVSAHPRSHGTATRQTARVIEG